MSTSNNSLYWACLWGDKQLVLKLANRSDSVNYVSPHSGDTPLHQACKQGWLDVIKLLIEKYGGNPNVKNKYHESVLHYACRYGHIDIVKYLIDKWHLNPLLRAYNIFDQVEPLDCALCNNNTAIAVYLCQHCISSDEVLNPNRIKTTINLIKYILRANSQLFATPKSQFQSQVRHGNEAINPTEWKTADGDNILQFVGSFKTFTSHIPSAVVLEILNSDSAKYITFNPDYTTSDGDNILELVCQSEIYLSQTPSGLILKWLGDTVINQVTKSIPDSMTVDYKILIQLVCQSEVCISHISTSVLSKWLSDTTIIQKLAKMMIPEWKTADGDTLLQLVCQSKACLSQISSEVLLIWLHNCTLFHLDLSLPDSETDDFEKLLQLVCQSETAVSQIPSAVLLKLLDETALELSKVITPGWKTADGDTVLQLVCQSKACLSRISSEILLIWLRNGTLFHVDISLPDSETADGEKLFQLVCQSEAAVSQISSAVLLKWLDITALDLSKVITPGWKTADGDTLLQLICHSKTIVSRIFSMFLTKWLSNPTTSLDINGHVPLQATSSSKIMVKLIEHGAKMTTVDVFKLITSESRKDSEINEILALSIRKQAILWNPNELNGDGYTALHLACKADDPTRVNILLSDAHCDPNIKSSGEEVPLQVTINPEIIKDLIRHGAKTSLMYESYQRFLGTNKPVQPPVKVFIVGNPSVGKSTLTAALKKKIGFIARIFYGKVSGVDKKTVGIVPHDIESDMFGRVTLYDFAGHREFYSGHAALLQTAIQSTPPIFLLVINLCEDGNNIIKNVLYWISFLENQCASVSCKPHIILVGSHADVLMGINPKDKIETIIDSLNTEKYFINMEYIGFVAMNCQYHESVGMSDLRRLLIKSCEELRVHEPITFNAHCFLVFLIDKFMNLTAVTIRTISEEINNQQLKEALGVLEFLPETTEALYKICLELNDRGHILLLKDRIAAENSYIVIDKEFLLSKISGTVFAPEGFKQHQQMSTNTGVVPRSKIAGCFPDEDLDILIGFLTHLEFCHEISDQDLHQLISEQHSQVSGERYYLFPGLISLQADDNVWQMKSEYDNRFGWVLKCIHQEQFFSSRFLQVLILRLAFSFALETSYEDPNQSIGIHRNCYMWKNGISWGTVFAMHTLVEVSPDNKSVLLLARFQGDDLVHCVYHRSEVISTILQCKEQFCPRVQTMELFLDSSSSLQYPLNFPKESNICTLQDLAAAVVSDSKSRRVVIQCTTIPAKDFLSFEPYLEMKLSTIQELCDEINEKKVVSESCLLRLAEQATNKLRPLIKTITGSSTNGISDDQLYHDLLRWRDSDKTKQKTYKDLRQLLDQYSVFAGRNVLELTSKQSKLLRPIEKEEQEKEEENLQCKLSVHGNRPKLHQLQLLKFPGGTELIRIMEKVTPEWDEVAIALGFDVARIKTIKMGAYYQPAKACLEMFTDWLAGGHDLKSPTWDSLIQSLRAAKLTEIADLLNRTIEIEADDTSASTLSTIAVDTESQVASSTATPDIINGNTKGPSIVTMLNVKTLEVMEGRRGRKVRVIESIGSQWEEVAKALDLGQEDIDMIKTRHSDNDEEACREMLATWLEGHNGEVSWTAFSQALIDAGLPELADLLKDALIMQF